MKRWLLLLLCLLVPRIAAANTPMKWIVPCGAALSNTTARYVNPAYGSVYSATKANVMGFVPGTGGATVGTVYDLRVTACSSGASGAGAGYTVTLRSGATGADLPTDLRCALTGTTTPNTCSNTTVIEGVTLHKGDDFVIEILPVSSPTAIAVSIEMDYVPATDNVYFYTGTANGVGLGTGTNYGNPAGSGSVSATEAFRWMLFASGGTVSEFCANLAVAPGGAATRTVKGSLNASVAGSPPSVTFNSGDSGEVCDNTNTLTIATPTTAAADRVAIQWTDNGGGPAVSTGRWAFTFTASVANVFTIPALGGNTTSTSAVRWLGIGSVVSNLEATTENATQGNTIFTDVVLKSAYGRISGSAGAAPDEYDTVLRDNAANASSTFPLQFANTGTTACANAAGNNGCAASGGDFTPASGHFYDTQITPVSTPANVVVISVSYLANMASKTFTPETCSISYQLQDYSAGVDAATVTMAALNSSMFGDSAALWSNSNISTAFTFDAASKTPFISRGVTFCNNPWSGAASPVGIVLATDDTIRYVQQNYTGAVADVVSLWTTFKTTYPSARGNLNMDLLDIHGGNNYVNVALSSNGTLHTLAVEILGTNGGSACSWTVNGTFYNAAMDAAVTNGIGIAIQFPIYNSGYGFRVKLYTLDSWAAGTVTGANLTPIGDIPGDESYAPCNSVDRAQYTRFGHTAVSSAGNTPGANNYYGPFYWCIWGNACTIDSVVPTSPSATGVGNLMLLGVGK